jgi:ubiquinone/menaquinone biosynthesis C-methylase UbiE
MRGSSEIPDYYRRTYESWYRWLSCAYDPFLRVMLFTSNGGFGGERRIRELVNEWIDPRPGERILDLCSGTGTQSVMLAKRLAGNGEVVGIKISPYQLRIARKKEIPPGLSYVEGDAQHIPFEDSRFDKGVILGALHEMPEEVRHKVLGEAYRVIKPGGQLVLVEHNKPSKRFWALWQDFWERFNPEFETYRNMLERGLTSEIERAGLGMARRETLFHEMAQIITCKKQ